MEIKCCEHDAESTHTKCAEQLRVERELADAYRVLDQIANGQPNDNQIAAARFMAAVYSSKQYRYSQATSECTTYTSAANHLVATLVGTSGCLGHARFDDVEQANYISGQLATEFGTKWAVLPHGGHWHVVDTAAVIDGDYSG